MNRLVPLLVGTALGALAVAITAAVPELNARRSGQAQAPSSEAFLNAEYWTCPQDKLAAFDQATDSIWGPLFDQLVQEGKFLDWSKLVPVKAFKYPLKDGRRSRQEAAPEWSRVTSWRTRSEEAFNAAWAEFASRLRAKFPDDPRPWRFCTDLTVVQYKIAARP